MSPLKTLRTSRWIAQLVLAWFALFLGSAWAASFIQADDLRMVCASGGGVKWVHASGEESPSSSPAGMDCPLCATLSPPPAPSPWGVAPASPHARALPFLVATHWVTPTAPPLPSRGPPLPRL